jgi:MFS family permease
MKMMLSGKMTTTERRSIFGLSSIMALRMIGLFMVLPVFSLYASQLKGATAALVGIAMGIYGLSQALFQIPFGMLSDRLGRKPIIIIGLLIFIAGSLIAGMSHSIAWMIVGRTLQGAGAIGSTTLAMIADLTREEQRTKSMAIAGMTIGMSFAVAMFIGPILTKWIAINSLFFLAAGFGLVAIFIVYAFIPTPHHHRWQRDTEPELKSFLRLLVNPELAKLNSGIFILHAVFTASFIVIPLSLLNFVHLEASQQWVMYLPTLCVAFILTLFCTSLAERQQKLKPYFLSSILLLALSEVLLWQKPTSFLYTAIGIGGFFTGFSILEAFLPSLISRTAPAARKGSALGLYSCAQFLGIFVGGVLGGWLYGKYHFLGVYLFCIILALFWFVLAYLMQPPRYLVTQILRLSSSQQSHWNTIAASLQRIQGIVEVTFIAEDGIAYLKMERGTATHPDFIRLKEQLQSN